MVCHAVPGEGDAHCFATHGAIRRHQSVKVVATTTATADLPRPARVLHYRGGDHVRHHHRVRLRAHLHVGGHEGIRVLWGVLDTKVLVDSVVKWGIKVCVVQ